MYPLQPTLTLYVARFERTSTHHQAWQDKFWGENIDLKHTYVASVLVVVQMSLVLEES